jgi:hypothetical protein
MQPVLERTTYLAIGRVSLVADGNPGEEIISWNLPTYIVPTSNYGSARWRFNQKFNPNPTKTDFPAYTSCDEQRFVLKSLLHDRSWHDASPSRSCTATSDAHCSLACRMKQKTTEKSRDDRFFR